MNPIHSRAFHEAERRRLEPPEPDPILSGTIAQTLMEGIYSEREVEIEYDTRDGLTIYAATLTETGQEIDPAEITPRDREAFRDAIWENYENER
jgi:hypothetical protein